VHDLLVRKTKLPTVSQRIDVVRELQETAISHSKIWSSRCSECHRKGTSRVGHYTDMGRYLFATTASRNRPINYVRGLEAASEPLTFAKDALRQRELDQRLRNQDAQNINDDIRKMQGNHGRALPSKDLEEFVRASPSSRTKRRKKSRRLEHSPDSGRKLVRDNKFDQAEAVLKATSSGPAHAAGRQAVHYAGLRCCCAGSTAPKRLRPAMNRRHALPRATRPRARWPCDLQRQRRPSAQRQNACC